MRVKIELRRKLRRLKDSGVKHYARISNFCVIVVFLLVCIFNLLLFPRIELDGKDVVVLDYHDEYVEKGYKAEFLGNDVSKKVTVSGKVNSKKVGVYKITYQIKEGFFSKSVSRKVMVVDKKKPKLEIDDSDLYLCPGDEVVPSKVKAFDEYDGDLSDKIKVDIGKSYITYSVSDSSGNYSEVKKKVIYKDIVSPELELKGSKNVYLFLGDKFKDDGYNVKDNCDRDISDKVKVDGSVDTSKVGEYEITYSVSDSAGNESKVVRKVKVSERSRNGSVYLTFDDGPKSGTTDVILDILKEEGVKATFFVTNGGPDELIKRAYDEGHSIALHTASHDYARVYASVDDYFSDLYSVSERVKRITGYESKIIRFPGGSSNTISTRYSAGIMSSLVQEVQNRGFRYYDWNLSSGDAAGGRPSPEEIRDNVIRNLRKDRVNMVLMHDIKPYTRDALRDIIRYGKENGYSFEKITMSTEMVTQRVNN